MSRFNPKQLTPEETDAIVSAKIAWILKGCRPRRIFVFGSAARYEMTDHSDVDLALLFSSPQEVASARRTLYATPREEAWPQDLLLLSEDEFAGKSQTGGVCFLIAQEGRLVFEAQESA